MHVIHTEPMREYFPSNSLRSNDRKYLSCSPTAQTHVHITTAYAQYTQQTKIVFREYTITGVEVDKSML